MKKPVIYLSALFLSTVLLFSCASNKKEEKEIVTSKTVETTIKENSSNQTDTCCAYTTVEEMPQFPGGEAEMQRYIAENLKGPKTVEDVRCTKTRVRFIISTDGSIRDAQVLLNADCALSDSLIKLVMNMPRWTPGKHNGKAVDVYFTLPLHIRSK